MEEVYLKISHANRLNEGWRNFLFKPLDKFFYCQVWCLEQLLQLPSRLVKFQSLWIWYTCSEL